MSDYNIPTSKFTFSFKNPYQKKSFGKGGMTDAQQELLPYIQEQRLKKEKDSKLWQPLELVFDLLRRGQYATANFAQDVQTGNDPLKGALEGVLGERKGTWKTTLFGGQDEGSKAIKGYFPQASDSFLKKKFDIPIISQIFGPTTGEDLIGMVGDIFLDPTTYLSFGSTAASKAAAAKVARFTVENASKGIGIIKNLTGFTRPGFKVQYFEELIHTGTKAATDKAEQYLAQHLEKKAMNRFMEETYNKAFKDALKSTPGQIQKNLVGGLTKNREQYIQDAAGFLAGKGKKVANELGGSLQGQEIGTLQGLMDLTQAKRFDKVAAGEAYKGLLGEIGGKAVGDVPGQAGGVLQNLMDYSMKLEDAGSKEFLGSLRGLGERGMNFMGQEFGKSVRQPWIVSRTWDAFKNMIGDVAGKIHMPFGGGASVADAAYAILNTGVVGGLRKMFGFRNPYQQMLRGIEMSAKHAMPHVADQEMNKVTAVLEGVDDPDLMNKTVMVMAEAHQLARFTIKKGMTETEIAQLKQEASKSMRTLLSSQVFLNKYKINPEEAAKILESSTNLKALTDEWDALEREWGIPHKQVMFYLPGMENQVAPYLKKTAGVTGTATPGFTKTQKIPPLNIIKQEKEKFKALLGVDDATAEYMVGPLNWSSRNMNLKEMYMNRAIAHARAITSAEMVANFKNFGIKIGGGVSAHDFNPADVATNNDLYASLVRGDANLSNIGLFKGKDERLSEYWFDKDVADIVNRTLSAVGSDEALQGFQKFMNNTSAYWRAVAVLTPGFTISNAKSNTVTGFLNYGPAFLDPRLAIESWVITGHGLGLDDWVAKKFNIKSDRVRQILAKDFNGRTGAELGEYLSKNGIISQGSMMYDVPSYIKKAAGEPNKNKFNITSTENVVIEGSRTINSIVESTPKVSGYILEGRKMAGVEAMTEGMDTAAIQQVKKLWFDYEDLTDFEKNIMKNIMPFYTWVRKNLAYQINQMLGFQGLSKMSQIPKVENAFSENLTDEEKLNMPGYMREQDWQKTGEGATGPVMQHPRMPWEDINKIPVSIGFSDTGMPELKITAKETWDEVMGMASPILKTVAAVTTGRDPFRKKDLEAGAPAPRVLRWLASNKTVMTQVDGMLKFFGNPKGLGVTKGDNGELVIDGSMQYILEANMPLLNRIDQLGDTITQFFPQIEQGVAKLTGFEKGYDKAEQTMKVMSFALGITQKEVNQDQQELYRYREILKEAQKQRSADMALLPGQTKRTNDYLKREKDRMKKLGLMR